MKYLKMSAAAVLIVLLWGVIVSADNSNRIYGKMTTVDGDVFEGLIRWDKNEGSWVDVLDATKERSRREKASSRSRTVCSRK